MSPPKRNTRSRKADPVTSTSQEEPKKKPAYKNADRATYKIDPVTGDKYYECPKCFKRLKGHLTIHMRIHNQSQPWECNVCGKRFSQKCNLQTHLQMHGKIESELSKNNQQDLEAMDVDLTNTEAFPKRTEKSKISFISDEEVDDDEKQSFPCDKCELSFPTSKKLSDHKKWTHTYRGGVQHYCVFCEKVFKRKEYLDIHIRKHIGEDDVNSYKCDKCKKTFFNEANYQVHCLLNTCKVKVKKDNRIPIYKCSECAKVYETKQGFRRHFLNNHLQSQKQYKCLRCSKAFHTACFLKMHMVKHTGERPHHCPICKDSFKHQSTLSQHLNRKHDIEDKDDLELFLRRRLEAVSRRVSELIKVE